MLPDPRLLFAIIDGLTIGREIAIPILTRAPVSEWLSPYMNPVEVIVAQCNNTTIPIHRPLKVSLTCLQGWLVNRRVITIVCTKIPIGKERRWSGLVYLCGSVFRKRLGLNNVGDL